MATYVERVRAVTSTESDDFFTDETILFYLNRSKQSVLSYLVSLEERSPVTLRALDDLRSIDTVASGTFGSTDNLGGGVYRITFDFPADVENINYLEYGDSTSLREVKGKDLIKLKSGNLIPSSIESYYNIGKASGTGRRAEAYLYEDPNSVGAGQDIRVYYISTPTAIILADETMTDIPERLENAIVYGAATMLLLQESINNPNWNPQYFEKIYDKELQMNTY